MFSLPIDSVFHCFKANLSQSQKILVFAYFNLDYFLRGSQNILLVYFHLRCGRLICGKNERRMITITLD